MFTPIDQLPTHRIQKKLHDGLNPTHISLRLASNTIAKQLSSYSDQTPEEFIDEMCDNLILEMEEKHEILDKMLPNRPLKGFEHFCICLQKKDVDDIKDFLKILLQKSSLVPLAAYFQAIIQRCEHIQQNPATMDTDSSRLAIKLILS